MPISLLEPGDTRDMEPQDRLAYDASLADATYRKLQGAVRDTHALLCMISAAPGSRDCWMLSVRRILEEGARLQKRMVVVLGLNNDAEFHGGSLSSKAEIVTTKLKAKVSPGLPAGFNGGTTRRNFEDALTGTRPTVIALRQPPSSIAAGKIRMINDANGVIVDAMKQDIPVPAQTLLMDVESLFMETPEPGDVPDVDTHGLMGLLAAREGCAPPQIVGARTRNVVYQKTDRGMSPDFLTEVSPMHRRMNRRPHNWLTGGGIFGDTAALQALLRLVSRYGGLRSDDSALERVARTAGMHVIVEDAVTVTNRCAPGGPEADRQLARWHAGGLDLDELYGEDRAAAGLESSRIRRVGGIIKESVRHPIASARVAIQKRRVNRLAEDMRGDAISGKAAW